MKTSFEIKVDINGGGYESSVLVEHQDETFDLLFRGKKIGSILNNGDNTWQLVEGDLSQEVINIVGDKIETYFNSENL